MTVKDISIIVFRSYLTDLNLDKVLLSYKLDIDGYFLFSLVDSIPEGVDIASLIFVLSAIHPDKFLQALCSLAAVLKPGGLLVFRDYGLYDMAQLRFGRGNKLGENFYVRQDGTR